MPSLRKARNHGVCVCRRVDGRRCKSPLLQGRNSTCPVHAAKHRRSVCGGRVHARKYASRRAPKRSRRASAKRSPKRSRRARRSPARR